MKTPNTAGGYANLQFRKGYTKETGDGGYANFRKTPNTAGGYADFQFKKYAMKAKGAGGYAFFRKHVVTPQFLRVQTP